MSKERIKVNESAEVIASHLRKDGKFSQGVRLSGRPVRLNSEELSNLKRIVLSSPTEHGFPSGTWTWVPVSKYIENTFHVEFKKAQMYNILHSTGLSFQKGKGFFPESENREEAVAAIKKLRERSDNSAVMFEDEASLSNTATVSYAWSEKEKQPKISRIQRRRERKTIFGAVNPLTGELITDTAERGNTKTFFRFLLKCLPYAAGKNIPGT
jgi:transposase